MAYTGQDTINWAQPFIQYSPLTAGTNNEPAVSIINMLITTITSAPFTWGWNRAEYTDLVLAPSKQDYTVPLKDFSFLEKVTLIKPDRSYSFELRDVYNTNVLGVSVSKPAEPKSVSVNLVNYGTDLQLRFISIPDLAYTSVVSYQKLISPVSDLGTPWPIPQQYKDIFNNLFLAEAFQAVDDDQEAQRYRMRGVAALLSKAEGLTEMQRNAFLSQFLVRGSQAQIAQLRTQQAQQARSI